MCISLSISLEMYIFSLYLHQYWQWQTQNTYILGLVHNSRKRKRQNATKLAALPGVCLCICHVKLVIGAQCVNQQVNKSLPPRSGPFFPTMIQCTAHITADVVSVSRPIVSHYSLRGLKKLHWGEELSLNLERSIHLRLGSADSHLKRSRFDNLGQDVWQNYTWCMQKFRRCEQKLVSFLQISSVSCNLTSI